MSIVREILDGTVGADETDSDTAHFQGTWAEYQIEGQVDLNNDGDYNDTNELGVLRDLNFDGDTNDAGEFNTKIRDTNGDGFISVRDRDTGLVGALVDGVQLSSRGLLTDDHDLLKNVEIFQFADRTIVVAGANNLAEGTVTISDPTPFDGFVTPYVGQVLTASMSNLTDADGLNLDSNGRPVGMYYEWQTTEVGGNSGWSLITTGDNYTVRSVDPGHILRAVAVFNDAAGNTERVTSVPTDNPTAAFSVLENSPDGTMVANRIAFSPDYDSQSINGNPPIDVDLATLYHEIDPANSSGGRFTVVANGLDFAGYPQYAIVVDHGGPVLLNYEAPVHTPGNQSYQFQDNQYQIVINTYSDAPANGGVLVAVRQFTVLLNDVTGEIADVAPTLDLHAGSFASVTRQYQDTFSATDYAGSTGTTPWTTSWVETGDDASRTTGQIRANAGGTSASVLQLRADSAADGASIERTVDLSGASTVNLSYFANEFRLAGSETVTVSFAADGVNYTTIQTISATPALGVVAQNFNQTFDANVVGPFSATAKIKFEINTTQADLLDGLLTSWVNIDGVRFTATVPGAIVPGPAGNNYTTSYTENGVGVTIVSLPDVADVDSPQMMGATITVTNANAADVLSIAGVLPGGITSSFGPPVAGQLTMYLSGPATQAQFEAALAQVRFSNSSDSPGAGVRTIQVTVSDGEKSSPIATASVTVVAVDDPTVANSEGIVTNVALGQTYIIPEWALLANDVDLDSPLDVTAVTESSDNFTATLLAANAGVSINDTDGSNNSLTYTANGTATALDVVTHSNPTETVAVRDNFTNVNYGNNNGTSGVTWAGNWTETGDDGSSNNAAGQIRINGGTLVFDAASTLATSNGASIQRSVNLTGGTNAVLTYNFVEAIASDLETVTVEFDAEGDGTYVTLETINNSSGTGNRTFNLGGTYSANATLRFTASAMDLDTDTIQIDNVNIAYTRQAQLSGGGGDDIIVGDASASPISGGGGNDIIFGGGGNDIVQGGGGNDTIVLASNEGRDIIDGGGSTDTFQLNGLAGAETFNIYTRDVWLGLGANNASMLNANTEIVVTLNGSDNASVIAELNDIEEIVVNTLNTTVNNGNGTLESGLNGGDTINVFGDFTQTSLDYSTITVNGSDAADTVDITGLTSAHRVVFNGGGGGDALIGEARPQDVFDFAAIGEVNASATTAPAPTTTPTLPVVTPEVVPVVSTPEVVAVPDHAPEVALRGIARWAHVLNGGGTVHAPLSNEAVSHETVYAPNLDALHINYMF